MPIKISITIQLSTWPRTPVLLSQWSRVRTHIQRKYDSTYSPSWSFPSSESYDTAVESIDQPPQYGDPCPPPKILITPSTPDEYNASSYFESRIQSASTEQVGQVIFPQSGIPSAYFVDSDQHIRTDIDFRLIL